MSLAALFGENDINEHQVAWLNRDWDAVKKLSDGFKESAENEFFYILNQINNQNRRRINTDEFESYSTFAVNSALSKHIDCIQHVFNMNLIEDSISEQMHFDYLHHSIRPAKRFAGAGEIADPIETMVDKVFAACVAKFYEVNIDRAAEYIDNFTDDQIKILKRRLMAMVDESFVAKVCPRANKTNISKIVKEVKTWNK